MPTKELGFTLIEVLVSISIIAVIATISMPFIRHYQPNFKLDGFARDLTTDLRLCQQLSIAEQISYYLAVATTTNQYSLFRTGSSTPLKVYKAPSELSFYSVTGLASDTVTFNAYGAVSQAGVIKLNNTQNRIKTINIKPSGYVELLP